MSETSGIDAGVVDTDTDESSSEKWLNIMDRGGLSNIKNCTYQLSVIKERL